MDKQQLLRKRQQLEEENQQLARELIEVDQLMRLAGFSNGLETVKATAKELVRYKEDLDFSSEDYAA
jgi:hypothetical protein